MPTKTINHTKVKVVKHLTDKGYPVHDKRYPAAHQAANKAEKQTYPNEYAAMKQEIRKMPKHELAGKHTKDGQIEIEQKYMPYAKTITKHEVTEARKEPPHGNAKTRHQEHR